MQIHKSPNVDAVKLQDSFLAPKMQLAYNVTIPSCLAKCEETHRLDAIKMKWQNGMDWEPHIFWDSDVAKVVEGMAYMLKLHPEDSALRERLDEIAADFIAAQQPDGYLNSFFTQYPGAERWSSVCFDHELYCAGHLMEAAVAHYEATGSRTFLDCLCRYADYIGTVFGPEDGKIHCGPGHEEIELALCKLADATKNPKYAKLAKYFVDVRGTNNYYAEEKKRFDMYLRYPPQYNQSHIPVREQAEAIGHAVRAVYLFCGMADVAANYNDTELLNAAIRLFDNIVNTKLYITGGIGSASEGEKFERRYHLPDDTNYSESCASIGMALFAWRLANITGEARFADILEQEIYNGAVSGFGLSGDHFFYANPMELLEKDRKTIARTYSIEREPWFNCSCCPTNYCRFLPQLGRFCWAFNDDSAAMYIPAACEAKFNNWRFVVESGYPYDGNVMITVCTSGEYTLKLRIPWWCGKWSLSLNGNDIQAEIDKGFACIRRRWHEGDKIAFILEMPPVFVHASPLLSNEAGKTAIMRGPLVYAIEQHDNGDIIPYLHIDEHAPLELCRVDGLPDGTVAIRGTAICRRPQTDALYYINAPAEEKRSFIAIPYALWQNRTPGLMRVWS